MRMSLYTSRQLAQREEGATTRAAAKINGACRSVRMQHSAEFIASVESCQRAVVRRVPSKALHA